MIYTHSNTIPGVNPGAQTTLTSSLADPGCRCRRCMGIQGDHMKRSIPFAVLALTGALLSACAPHPTPDATKPTVALTAAPTTVTAAGTITLSATATDKIGRAHV